MCVCIFFPRLLSFLYVSVVKKVGLHCCVCVVISFPNTDEGVNGDSIVVCVVISSLPTDEGVNGDIRERSVDPLSCLLTLC